ncbi:hypothetical protein INT47_001230 [Mucor saturninus]|uniref:RNI-like protein n=1 Tax=Mucor saturninus TaxID=64648 RepID=A0A8H7RP04_9FUNG|nr:hypothetical protein INT47_001230 [Mucor saturninus]
MSFNQSYSSDSRNKPASDDQHIDFSMDEFCNLLSQPPIESKLYRIIPLVYPYLSTVDILVCASASSTLNHVFDYVYNKPNFQKLSYIHDALFMFNKFLFHLPKIREKNLSKIEALDLSNIQETLYDPVNPNFFRILVQYCRKLLILDLSHSDFFMHKSLPKHHWQLPHLTVLNLSDCSQVTDEMLVSIARSCRAITHVALDNLTRHKGQGLAAFASDCDSLTSVSVRFNTAMEDQALTALAKFRHIRLFTLDLTGCKKITSVGLTMIARYCAHLTRLSLSQTVCTLIELRKFICILRSTHVLDISGCKQLDKNQVANWICNSQFLKLKEITMDTSIANAIVQFQGKNNNATTVPHVTNLTLTQLAEHTPMSCLYELLTVFPSLERVSFQRAYFETDFMLGTYRAPSPEDEAYITDANLERYNRTQTGVHAVMLKEEDQNLLHW